MGKRKIATRVVGLKDAKSAEITVLGEMPPLSEATFSTLVNLLASSIFQSVEKRNRRQIFALYQQLQSYANRWQRSAPNSTSIAPIRAEPKRIYDRWSEEYNPGGDHVPFVLAGILQKDDTKKGKVLISAVETFGQESGLFHHLNVKRLGTKAGDPFKVQVMVGGPSVNLSDVGYGVNQSLPIIVESLLRLSDSRILLQQPEVHLHPRAQAALEAV